MQDYYAIGKTYTLTVDTLLMDIYGNKLQHSYVATFVPEPNFRVFYVTPSGNNVESDNYYPGPYSFKIKMKFNSAVTSDIVSAISFSPNLSGHWIVSGDNSADSTYLQFNNTEPLLFNTIYTVFVH